MKTAKANKQNEVIFLKATVLNKDDRSEFVSNVMADVPHINYSEILEKEGRADLENQLPAEIKKMMKSETLSKYLGSSYVSITDYREMDGIMGVSIRTAAQHEKFTPAFLKRKNELVKLHNEQIETRSELTNKLSATASVCKTDKALAERLPEFAKYIPKKNGVSSANLPALANLVADFTKAGWPKTAKKGAAK